MRTTILLGLLCALAGCDRRGNAAGEQPQESPKMDTQASKPAADNTERNERDREPNALTPGDQGESESDREITRLIRRGVMDQEGMSTNAQNVKIITVNGVVTLRGPVDSATEKSRIASLAQSTNGVKRVDNQIEIAAGKAD